MTEAHIHGTGFLPTMSAYVQVGKNVVNSVEEFVREYMVERNIPYDALVLRGHADKAWRTQPSVFRGKDLSAFENRMGSDLMVHHHEEFRFDVAMFDRLVRFQHYGIRTRLLDVTSNPFVALYFACNSHFDCDGQVISYYVPTPRYRYSESDTVAVLANIANLTQEEKANLLGHVRFFLKRGETDGHSSDVEAFNEKREVQRLVSFIRREKPGFEPKVDFVDLFNPLFVQPRLSNNRIIAQSGSFLIYGFDPIDNSDMFNEERDTIKQVRFDIPAVAKPRIVKELDKLAIRDSTLFPEIDKAASFITKRYESMP